MAAEFADKFCFDYMKPEIATIWTDALRSGEYKQGREALRDSDNNYCCLGVLSQLAVEAGVIPEPCLDEDSARYGYLESDDYFIGHTATAGLSSGVRQWSGVTDSLGRFFDSGCWNSLAVLNDNGRTFFEIADIIDANVEKL